jgi:hypothetical protein
MQRAEKDALATDDDNEDDYGWESDAPDNIEDLFDNLDVDAHWSGDVASGSVLVYNLLRCNNMSCNYVAVGFWAGSSVVRAPSICLVCLGSIPSQSIFSSVKPYVVFTCRFPVFQQV